MSTPRIPLLVSLLLLATLEPARAWTAPTRMRMVDEAVRLMPPSLRVALEHQREPLMRGALEPMTAEDGPSHRPPWQGGQLDREIVARMNALALASAEMKSFREVARRFGELAHFVADASFPPGAAGEPGECATNFLLGLAFERGIDIWICDYSSLMDNDRVDHFYGYQEQPKI